jgi:hypothetical protein
MANAGRFGYASGGLGTEAHRRSCFTPPEAAGGHYRETAKEDVLAVSRALELALFMDAKLDVSKI